MDIYRDPSIQPQLNQNNALLANMPTRYAQNLSRGEALQTPQAPQQQNIPPQAPPAPSQGMPPNYAPPGSVLSSTPPSSSLSAPQGSLLATPPPAPPESSVLGQSPTGVPSPTGANSALDGMSPDAIDFAKTQGLGTIGGEQQISPQDAEAALNSGDEKGVAQLAANDQGLSFIHENDPRARSLFEQTNQYKIMDGTDGGALPISEDNGSVYNCPFTKTPCSRPSFFRRIGAFLKRAFGIFDDNQALATCQAENLRDPVARQVLISTGDFDNEMKQQLAEKTQSQGMASTVSSMPAPQSSIGFGTNQVPTPPYTPTNPLPPRNPLPPMHNMGQIQSEALFNGGVHQNPTQNTPQQSPLLGR